MREEGTLAVLKFRVVPSKEFLSPSAIDRNHQIRKDMMKSLSSGDNSRIVLDDAQRFNRVPEPLGHGADV